jgi:Asp-tRNA(Asn)/Glu-tRNA(Gln) amidotransferase C subunit
VIELENILRDDVPGASLTPDEALSGAPERQGDYFVVPVVVEGAD